MTESPRPVMCSHSQGGAISWKNSKQSVTASSTMYAEFVACYEASVQVEWLKKFIPGLRVVDSIQRPLIMYCDNEPAVFYAHNNKSSGTAKHIDIKFYVVEEKIQNHSITLEHISIKKYMRIRSQKAYHPMCSMNT